jgi:hypothetical protein
MISYLIRTWSMSLGILLLTSISAEAHNGKNNRDKDNRDSLKNTPLPVADAPQKRSFPQLNTYVQNAQTAFSIPLESPEAAPEFTLDYITQNFTVSAEMADARSQAVATIDEIERRGSYTDYLTSKDLVELPIGLKKKLGNTNVTVGISKAKFLPEYTLLTIFCKIDLPQGKSIFFGADNVKLSHKGGLVSGGDLVLLGDFQVPFNGGNSMLTLKGGLNMSTGDVKKLTYVTFECNGVKNLGIAADISFPRSLLVPITADNKVEPDVNKKVTGSFSVQEVTDWNDIMGEISLPKFAIKGLERVVYQLDKAIIDLSDFRNNSAVSFPANYSNIVPGSEGLWRGVFIEKFSVILPKEFKDKNNDRPVSFEAKKLIIDNTGLTGVISANNILSTGSASGWDFSVDKFEIELQSNSLRRAGFNGAIAIPVTKKKNPLDSVKHYGLGYRAVFFSNNDYLMNVSIKDSLSFDMWKARAKLLPGSYIELVNKDDKFLPKAVLTGELKISVSENGNSEFGLSSLAFQNLTIQTVEPYLKIEGGGFTLKKGANNLANFPITVDAVRLNISGNQAIISLDTIRLNLMENGENKLKAKGSLAIVSEISKVGDDFKFEYKRLLINQIGINANFKGFKMDGEINIFREHPIMGTGLSGSIGMTVGIGGKDVRIDAKAAFGRKSYRYWYVDALASGFNIPLGTFNINGLGGGASYQMQRSSNVKGNNIAAVCPSGIGFIPDSTVGVGFRAMTTFSIGTKSAAQGDLTFEMLFNRTGGGLARLGLYGKATILPPTALLTLYNGAGSHLKRMSDMLGTQTDIINLDTAGYKESVKKGDFGKLAIQSKDTLVQESAGSIYASVGLDFDFNNKVLDGNFEVFMNVAGGLIVGAGDNFRAGQAKLHIEKKRWYLFLGTSEEGKQLSVKFNMGSGGIQASTYLMVGDSIGSSPPPPVQVASILGRSVQELSYMRDLNTLANGGGFAFGANIKARFDSEFGKVFSFYAKFNAGIGFDIMIKRYLNGDGTPAHCAGQNSPLGINGWYANGQAYAYLEGQLGIRVDLLFIKKDIDIIEAGAAVLLQAKGPNPTWMTGYLGGRFALLGGRVKGSFSCKVSFGTNCVIEGTPAPNEQIEYITNIIPDDKNESVDPLGTVQAQFKYPLEQPFYLSSGETGEQVDYDKNDMTQEARDRANSAESVSILLKARLTKFQLTNRAGKIIAPTGTPVILDNGTRVEYPNTTAFSSDDSITATVEVAFDAYDGYSWTPYTPNGQAATQTKTSTFKTAKRPTEIPLSNIEYTYPVIGQKYFYPREHNKGFIKLLRGQGYLFTEDSQLGLTFTPKNTVGSNSVINVPITYDDITREFIYNMPILNVSEAYTLQITAKKPTSNTVRTILKYNFNTSQHNTFAEKLNTFTPKSFYSESESVSFNIYNDPLRVYAYRSGTYMGFKISANIAEIENFDRIEVKGSLQSGNKPLINPIAVMNDAYYINSVQPLLSLGYTHLKVSRDTSVYGAPPSRAIIPSEWGLKDTSYYDKFPYIHAVSSYFLKDIEDFKNQLFKAYPPSCPVIVNNNYATYGSISIDKQRCPIDALGCTFCCADCASSVPSYLKDLYIKSLPRLPEGKYDVKFRYLLPNGLETSSTIFGYYHSDNNSISVDAGADQLKISDSFILDAKGTGGTWSIIQAPQGFSLSNISDITSPTATVTGVPVNSDIILKWSAPQASGLVLSDVVTLTHVSGAIAGVDQTGEQDTFNLQGNARGKWSIVNAETCAKTIKISDENDSKITVTNVPVQTPITLRWTLDDGTGTLFDDVIITKTLPINMAGEDVIQFDSVFTLSSKVKTGYWSVNSDIAVSIEDTASWQTELTISEPNKPINVKWTVTDSCGQSYIDETTLFWANTNLGSNQCLGSGNFTVKGYGTGTWSIADASAGLSVAVDSFVTKGDFYTSIFNMPVSRLPLNGSITLKWTQPNGYITDVQFKRIVPISAGIDQAQFDSVFTLNGSLGNGTWSIASAPSNFTLANIEDIYSPTTKVTLPANTTVQLIWTIEDECRKGVDTVVLVRKLSLAKAGPDLMGSRTTFYMTAQGQGTWSILKQPQNAYVRITSLSTPNTDIYITAPADSMVSLRWTLPDGDFDDVIITKKAEPIVNVWLFVDSLYNPSTGKMTRPDNILQRFETNFIRNPTVKNKVLTDTTIVGQVWIGYRRFYGDGGYFNYYLLRNDGAVIDIDGDTNIYPGYTFIGPSNSALNEPNEPVLFNKLLLLLNHYDPFATGFSSYISYETMTKNPILLSWGQLTVVDFTNQSPPVRYPQHYVQMPHPSGQPIYVLKTF